MNLACFTESSVREELKNENLNKDTKMYIELIRNVIQYVNVKTVNFNPRAYKGGGCHPP